MDVALRVGVRSLKRLGDPLLGILPCLSFSFFTSSTICGKNLDLSKGGG